MKAKIKFLRFYWERRGIIIIFFFQFFALYVLQCLFLLSYIFEGDFIIFSSRTIISPTIQLFLFLEFQFRQKRYFGILLFYLHTQPIFSLTYRGYFSITYFFLFHLISLDNNIVHTSFPSFWVDKLFTSNFTYFSQIFV